MSKTNGSWRNQIEVRASTIHGRGLFATKRIAKGKLVGVFEGVVTKKDDTHVLWTQDEDDVWHGLRVTNELKYANHSASPNTETDGTHLHALRTIQAGEEITFHYGEEWDEA